MLMLGYNYAAFISDGSEKYFSEEKYLNDNRVDTKTVRFPDSLLDFLYLDINGLEPLLKKISDDLWQLTLTKDQSYLESAYAVLDELAARHTYFEELRIEYRYRAARAVLLDHYTEDILQRQVLVSLPSNLRMIQTQHLELVENVLDIDRGKMGVRKKLAGYYRENRESAFRFSALPMSFELMDEDTFAEVLRPNSIYDLTDFHARECVKREVRMRRCKNCGRYFAIQIRSTAEYCDRVIDERGRTCKDVGAITLWTKNKKTDTLFNDYRREYKKRFARTKVGKYDTATLYAWGEQARAKVLECRMGMISEQEFHEWLENS